MIKSLAGVVCVVALSNVACGASDDCSRTESRVITIRAEEDCPSIETANGIFASDNVKVTKLRRREEAAPRTICWYRVTPESLTQSSPSCSERTVLASPCTWTRRAFLDEAKSKRPNWLGDSADAPHLISGTTLDSTEHNRILSCDDEGLLYGRPLVYGDATSFSMGLRPIPREMASVVPLRFTTSSDTRKIDCYDELRETCLVLGALVGGDLHPARAACLYETTRTASTCGGGGGGTPGLGDL